MKQLYIKFSRLIICLWLVFFLSCCTNLYLVRHAERLNSTTDSPLSALGFQRAEALRTTLSDKSIDSIFVSTYLRTQQTAYPLCKALSKNYVVYSTDTIEQFAQHLKLIKGKNILVVGHSNTIPQMVSTIADQTVSIPENVFNKMFIINIKRWPGYKIKFRETTYGAPSPPLP